MEHSNVLGSEPIGKLLIKQSVPAGIGFLVMSINSIVDTIFVGHFVGSIGIAAIAVVMPISFFISSIGLAIGIGGASIISRTLGAGNPERAGKTFGTQMVMTLGASLVLLVAGYIFQESVLSAFGGKGTILVPAKVYFNVILFGTPFLAWAMMSNNVIRAEGKPRIAMMAMVLPAIINIILDPILIIGFNMGLYGAAWATTIAYIVSAAYIVIYFLRGKSEIQFKKKYLILDAPIAGEIFSIGGVSLVRQGSVTLLIAILNQTLFKYGGETGVAIYGIIARMMMFSLFPVMGVVQGFMPIAGYNYGAKSYIRVTETVIKAVKYGTGVALLVFTLIILFPTAIVKIFTTDEMLIRLAPRALVLVFMAIPLITMQLIGSAYFQAIGKPLPALLLTLLKQGIFLIPLVLILPYYFDLNGVWYSFPIADILSTLITVIFLKRALDSLPINNIQSVYDK
ncbi:MAG: MATE family efflux transporter [Bacteroidetes bacterium]|nr:MATE family efflux transporter [Bacteroidota bacterium]